MEKQYNGPSSTKVMTSESNQNSPTSNGNSFGQTGNPIIEDRSIPLYKPILQKSEPSEGTQFS